MIRQAVNRATRDEADDVLSLKTRRALSSSISSPGSSFLSSGSGIGAGVGAFSNQRLQRNRPKRAKLKSKQLLTQAAPPGDARPIGLGQASRPPRSASLDRSPQNSDPGLRAAEMKHGKEPNRPGSGSTSMRMAPHPQDETRGRRSPAKST